MINTKGIFLSALAVKFPRLSDNLSNQKLHNIDRPASLKYSKFEYDDIKFLPGISNSL